MFLGVPHNFVQFTCIQEVLAGWLGVECGSYNQISDSLHVYDHNWERLMDSTALPNVSPSIRLPWTASTRVRSCIQGIGATRIEKMIDPETASRRTARVGLVGRSAPQAYRNIASRSHGRRAPPPRPGGVSWTESCLAVQTLCINSFGPEWCSSRRRPMSDEGQVTTPVRASKQLDNDLGEG